ncbi:MAG: hypothetical protein PHX54_06290 [Lentimicrobiaceae bacterium]|nr:hypothetical protein [Lentimicrobiaceae bacterium]
MNNINIPPIVLNKLEVESKLLGYPVFSIEANTPPAAFAQYEPDFIREQQPGYTQVLINSDELKNIGDYEDLGFRFVEFRLFKHLRTSKLTASSRSYFPYRIELIAGDEYLNQAVAMMYAHECDDRFSIDPYIPEAMAKKRLELYIRRSFRRFPAEFVLGLINHHTGELVAFRTGKYKSKQHVLYFYSYVSNSYDQHAFSVMLETAVVEYLLAQKVSHIEAVSSGLNVAEINESIHNYGYVVDKTMVLLRKIYPS